MINSEQANKLTEDIRELAVFTVSYNQPWCLDWLIAARAGKGYTGVSVAIEGPNSKEKAAYLAEYLPNEGYKTKLEEYSWRNLWGLQISWNNY